MRIIAFSDIHFCHSWDFLTVDDIASVHARIRAYVAECKPQLVLFLGDRFRARQPKDHVKAVADRELRLLADTLKTSGGDLVVIVGNHDKWSESVGTGNTYSVVDVFHDVLQNVHIIDKPYSLHLTSGIAIHALPAGFGFRQEAYTLSPGFNVFAFHGLIHGATYDQTGGVQVKTGVDMSDIDNPAWDFVLGGDVHVPQILPLNNTVGGYVGSALRFTEDDADDERGFLDIRLTKGQRPRYALIDGGGPRLARLAIGPDRNTWPDPGIYEDVILIVTIAGSAAELRTVANNVIHDHFQTCRYVKIHRKPSFEAPRIVAGIGTDSTPLDDVVAYIRATDRDGLDADRLTAKAIRALGATPQRKGLFA